MIDRDSECETLSYLPQNCKFLPQEGNLATRPLTACSLPQEQLSGLSLLQLRPEPEKRVLFLNSTPPTSARQEETGNNSAPSRGGASPGLLATLTQRAFIKEERQSSQPWPVYMGLATCLDTSPHREQNQVLDIFLDAPEAQSFLVGRRRFPRANHWDLELLTPGNLERECLEERCSWEEAREYFEDNTLTERFWESYTYNGKGGRGRVDVAGLAVGLTSGILLIVLAGLGAFWYLHYRRRRLRGQESCLQETGLIIPLSPQTPQSPPLPPGLPTYEQALAASGVHDAPPPPYSSLRRPH